MKLLDCTLRDGANVVGNGFSAELTKSMLEGLLSGGIRDIEFGNCRGLSAETKLGSVSPVTDREYLELAQPFVSRGNLGMFLMAGCADRENTRLAKESGLSFLRVGNNAGDGRDSLRAIELVKEAGLYCRYSLMKAYVLTPEALAEEAALLEKAGADCITVMDSAGTMLPEDAAAYVKALRARVSVPVGFHGHSNMGLSQANALAAVEAGAEEIDCGLLGMARSAGNCSTELAIASLQRKGYLEDVDLYGLLSYLDNELIGLMEPYGYRPAVKPVDLVLGIAGCHSSFLPLFREVAEQKGVNLYRLITVVSKLDRKKPDRALMERVAATLV